MEMKRSRQPWKPNHRTSESAEAKGRPKSQAEWLRETFISLLRKNDGEVLCKLLVTLSRDKSVSARRLIRCLLQQPELSDLIHTKRRWH